MKRLSIIRPDDWHLHIRDQAILELVLPWTTAFFSRAIIMPNLTPPIDRVSLCSAYRQRILQVAQDGFEPLMTLYLTEDMPPQTVDEAQDSGFIYGIKMYPRAATTHSDLGVQKIEKVFAVLERMEQLDMPLLVHGEYVADDIDVFDREKLFIDKILIPLRERFTQLRIVLEHITTKDAAAYVSEGGPQIAATITPHHLLYSRNAIFENGLRPHHYCLPLPQRASHRASLIAAATSGKTCFFAGTDSAPHLKSEKESACGCAGVFNAPVALSVYASIFDNANKLEHLEKFVSLNGAAFYKLKPNTQRITLLKEETTVPVSIGSGEHTIIPLLAGQTVPWNIQS